VNVIATERDRASLIAFIQRLPLGDGKRWEWVIKPSAKRRTLNQNAYIHSIFSYIGKQTQTDEGMVKDALKMRFLQPVIVDLWGEPLKTLPSTAKLPVNECSDFTEQLHAWAAEHGQMLPHPSDRY